MSERRTTRSELAAYLDSLTAFVRCSVVGDLVGLYISGSYATGDFAPDRSDVDVLAVSSRSVSHSVKERLARELAHKNLPCPAKGLDFLLVTSDTARTLPATPAFEFSIATGETWEDEVEFGGDYPDVLLDVAVCREFGIALYGRKAVDVFARVPDRRLGEILLNVIRWHRRHIFDPFHDPLGHYAVLNSCRAWFYAEEKVLCSKTDGAEWLLAREPRHAIVSEALSVRYGEIEGRLDRVSIEKFLDEAEAAVASAGGWVKRPSDTSAGLAS